MTKPMYFVELTPSGKLNDNVLMTTHDIHAHGTKLSGKQAYLFPIYQPQGGSSVPALVLHRDLIPLQRLRVIEGEQAVHLAGIDEDIRALQTLRADYIRACDLRKAVVEDFHTPDEEFKED